MIKKFHVLYVGQIELDNVGLNGTPANERRYSSERLNEVFETSRRVAKVMVSADGGNSYAEAALQEPVLPKAFTRFRMPWRWDGQPVVLQSRAWDEGGNVQPTRAEFVALRGETKAPPPLLGFPNQHYNSLTSWAVDANGGIKHVYA